MGHNLPPGVRMSDPDAPWNENHPDPDGLCRHCKEWYFEPVDERTIHLSEFRRVFHDLCPNCGEVMDATLFDETPWYLESWRSHPEEMEHTIDRYSELREIEVEN